MQIDQTSQYRKPFRHYVVVALIALGVISVIAILINQRRSSDSMNVILLTIDTMRPDRLTYAGYYRDTTPFLNQLARQGVIFSTVISSAPWTCPGLLSIFTGLYPMLHGVNARGRTVLASTRTLFDIFKEHGYRVPNIAYLTNIPNLMNLGLDEISNTYKESTHLPGDELIRWIGDHKDQQFLAWYHYRFLHLPYNPSAQFNVYLDAKGRELQKTPFFKEWLQDEVVIPWGQLTFTPDMQKTIQDLYDGQLLELDAFIRRLYDNLNELKMWGNTLLILTADHGEELFEHGFVGHASTTKRAKMYDEVLKIPLILYGPGIVPNGVEIRQQIRQIDIMPTVLDIAGLPIPKDIQGISLLPMIKGRQIRPIPDAISESIMGGYQSDPNQENRYFYSIREEKWKLVRIPLEKGFAYELFDLKNDPGETQNVIATHPQIAVRLKTQLETALGNMQKQRLALLTQEGTNLKMTKVPKGSVLKKPMISSPRNGQRIRITSGDQIKLQWSGDPAYNYVIEYDAGKGWRKLTGRIPVQGTSKIFGPLPAEAYEPLPYWNPYRIRVAPFGQEKYWSEWVEFYIEYNRDSS